MIICTTTNHNLLSIFTIYALCFLDFKLSSFPTTVLLLSNFRKVLQEMTNSQATVESELVTLATLKTPVEQSCKSNIPACRETLTFGIQ